MIIRTTRETLDSAMRAVSGQYEGNIRYRNLTPISAKEPEPSTRARYRLTITVKRSRGAGSSIDPIRERAISAACWHAHGHYFEHILALDPLAVIRTGSARIDSTGGNWQDYPRGSTIYPSYASEWCDCPLNGYYGKVTRIPGPSSSLAPNAYG